jgi:enoyl-CoA hydratase/carnithine racemase
MGLVYEQQDHVVTLTLNRPEAMNAIDPETHQELIDAWMRFRDDPEAWVAILTGAGEKAFSAGADLKKMIPQVFGKPGAGRSHNDPGLGGITRGMEIWKPVIAAVNGYALAGGLELVLCCDIRVAAEHAVFGLTEVRWAIMPGAGGTQRLPRTVPLAKAMEMILMGETCSAQEAHRIGLVNAVVPAADVLPTARRWAGIICERGPLAVRAAKEAIIRGLSLPLADGLRLEAFLSGTLRGTEDAVEGPKAFAEKRKPVFRAR